jgi:hypothetical protein
MVRVENASIRAWQLDLIGLARVLCLTDVASALARNSGYLRIRPAGGGDAILTFKSLRLDTRSKHRPAA